MLISTEHESSNLLRHILQTRYIYTDQPVQFDRLKCAFHDYIEHQKGSQVRACKLQLFGAIKQTSLRFSIFFIMLLICYMFSVGITSERSV